MTINKSQRQTIGERLGIYLPAPVFAHGQLYVAFPRAVAFGNVRVLLENAGNEQKRFDDAKGGQYTDNLVGKDLLSSAGRRVHS